MNSPLLILILMMADKAIVGNPSVEDLLNSEYLGGSTERKLEFKAEW